MTFATSDQPVGPFLTDDILPSHLWTVRDGHLRGVGRPGNPGALAGLDRAAQALEVVDCAPEARLIETAHAHLLDMLLEQLVHGLTRIAEREPDAERRARYSEARLACVALRHNAEEAYRPPPIPWDIRREGRGWPDDEMTVRFGRLGDVKFEVIDGKLFWDDETRLALLAMLMENVGLDAAVQLGDLDRWEDAVAARRAASRGP